MTLGFLLTDYRPTRHQRLRRERAPDARSSHRCLNHAPLSLTFTKSHDATAIVPCSMFPLNLFVSCAYTWIFRAEYNSFSYPLYARTDLQPRKASIADRPRLRQVPRDLRG
jgi:hypothetical protein